MSTALLLSGGMDSFALAYATRPNIALTVDYGQRPAKAEVAAARKLTERLAIRHEVVCIDLRSLGSGDLSESPAIEIAPATDWWPYRNQALITLAAMRLIGLGTTQLMIGTVKSDSVHADGRAEFIHQLDEVMRIQEGSMAVVAPAIENTTAELIRNSGIPYSLLAWAHSCHTGDIACGQCRGCAKHREVVAELGYAAD